MLAAVAAAVLACALAGLAGAAGRRAPDTIAFTSTRAGNADVWLIDACGGDLRNVTAHPAADRRPAWSPDGGRIAFQSDRDGNTSPVPSAAVT